MNSQSGMGSAPVEPRASRKFPPILGSSGTPSTAGSRPKGIPAQRIGRLWKFKLSEVNAWVRSGGAEKGGQRRVTLHRSEGAVLFYS